MSSIDPGWRGLRVKNKDGRTGVITCDNAVFLQVTLTITVDGTNQTERIQLNADGRDSGALGWSWCYKSPDREGEQWALLGDHNPKESENG